jgi:hypothetical protein|tara:strand:+ start:2087 stop:2263 length:177 start_codon:yes stop_codon:yes gene_type:complete
MTPFKKILEHYKSIYAASKDQDVTATQLTRLSKSDALVADSGQVWIKSKTTIKMDKLK